METTTKRSKLTTAFALSLAAGILILVQGIVRSLQGRKLTTSGISERALALHIVGAIAVVFGILVIVGAVLFYQLGREAAGGLIVLTFSLLSILTFGVIGLVGLILGVIGAALALKKK